MSIGSRIKELRLNMKLTQEKLARRLGVTKGAVANYEKEVSVPKTEIMYRLFSALNCDANYLYQDYMSEIYKNSVYSVEEKKLLNDFRKLDNASKNVVCAVIDAELARVKNQSEQSIKGKAVAWNGTSKDVFYSPDKQEIIEEIIMKNKDK